MFVELKNIHGEMIILNTNAISHVKSIKHSCYYVYTLCEEDHTLAIYEQEFQKLMESLKSENLLYVI